MTALESRQSRQLAQRAGPEAGSFSGVPPWLATAFLFITLAAGTSVTKADPDLWGHVRFGLDTLRTHTLPYVDPYSFTQDRPWINHEWFSELQMAAGYALAGSIGLIVLKAGLTLGGLGIVMSAFQNAPVWARCVVVLLTWWVALPITLTVRPQLWTFLFFAVLCRLLIAPIRTWWLAAIPSLFALWANAHGGWIVGMGVLGLWAVDTMLFSPSRRRLAAGVLAASVAATLMTPYGWELWRFIAETVRLSRADISEWQPLHTQPAVVLAPWIISLAIAAAAMVKGPVNFGRTAAIIMLGYASLRVQRLAPFATMAALLFFGPEFLKAFFRPLRNVPPRSRGVVVLSAVGLIPIVVVAAWFASAATACIGVDEAWGPDPVPVAALRDAGVTGRMVNPFDWGEYAIWELGPDVRVSIDGRRETVYAEASLATQAGMGRLTPAAVAFLTAHRPDYVWWYADGTALRSWLTEHGYRMDISTPRSYLAVRGDISRVPPQPARLDCFP